MNAPTSSRRIISGLGLLAVAVFLALVARFWHPVYGFTSFLQLDSSNDSVKIAAFRERPVFVYRETGGYDGLYYAQIAYHPTLTAAELAPAMDSLSYRARRILPPLLAWTLAAGNPNWIVHVYSVLNVAAWLVLALLLWRLLAVDTARGWLAWAGVLFSAGALASVRLALTDLVALAILAGAMLAAERGRRSWALGCVAASGLARETALLGLAGLFERPWFSKRNLLRIASAALPLAAWVLYVNWRASGSTSGLYNFTWPVAGYIGKWQGLIQGWRSEPERLAVWSTLLATIALTVQSAFFLIYRRPDDRWWRIGLAYTALLLCLGAPVWEGYPGAATRVLLPLNLAFNLLAHRSRAPLGWLLAGNLTVVAGLITLAEVPHDRRELAATRQHGVACVALFGDGWYAVEHSWRHDRVWSQPTSSVDLQTWTNGDQPVRLEFEIRSITARTVAVRDSHGVLWSGTVGEQKKHVSVATRLAGGRGHIEFSTPEAAVAETTGPQARQLAFALYDARLVLPEP